MKIVKMQQVPIKSRDTNDNLFIGDVTLQSIVTPADNGKLYMAQVNFSKKARNKLHSHTEDQILIVTSGKGIVSTGKEETVVTAGDVIFIPANEQHWHGATRDSEFSHHSISIIGNKTTRFED